MEVEGGLEMAGSGKNASQHGMTAAGAISYVLYLDRSAVSDNWVAPDLDYHGLVGSHQKPLSLDQRKGFYYALCRIGFRATQSDSVQRVMVLALGDPQSP
jgi:hypothetical protein